MCIVLSVETHKREQRNEKMTTIMTLEITETRPERLRVVKAEGWFLVQSNRPGQESWITQKEHRNEQEAIIDAATWY